MITAISSYVSRCVMSMDYLTHQIANSSKGIELCSGSGLRYSYLLRPWEGDKAWQEYKKNGAWKKVYNTYCTRRNFNAFACPYEYTGMQIYKR